MILNSDLILQFEESDFNKANWHFTNETQTSFFIDLDEANKLLREEMSKWKTCATLSDDQLNMHYRMTPRMPIKRETVEDVLRDLIKIRYDKDWTTLHDMIERARKVLAKP